MRIRLTWGSGRNGDPVKMGIRSKWGSGPHEDPCRADLVAIFSQPYTVYRLVGEYGVRHVSECAERVNFVMWCERWGMMTPGK